MGVEKRLYPILTNPRYTFLLFFSIAVRARPPPVSHPTAYKLRGFRKPMEPVAVVYHEGIANYDMGWGSPFRGNRFPKFMKLIERLGLLSDPRVNLVEPGPADDGTLGLIHPEEYIKEVERREAMSIPLSGDTPLRPGIVDAARLIVGTSVRAGELVADGSVRVAEGVGGGLHHAGRGYGGGFCVFNDVAVCAQNLLENHGLDRVIILDSDVHPGNGTMDVFYGEPRVLFVSVHQDPRTIYPGTPWPGSSNPRSSSGTAGPTPTFWMGLGAST
jgi:acetoin utilization protein AcuC